MAKRINGKTFDILSNVKAFYMHAFPSDEMGKEINPNISFAYLLSTMEHGGDVYETLGVHDSVIRERIFGYLALFSGIKVNKIYDMWYNEEELRKAWEAVYLPF